MEHACLLIKGLELGEIPEKERDGAFAEFGQLVDLFHRSKVQVYKQSGLSAQCFSYGTIYDLIYLPWCEFSKKEAFKGISQTTYQMVVAMSMQHPELGKEVTDEDWGGKEMPKTAYGMVKGVSDGGGYLTERQEWQELRARHYRSYPGSYVWGRNDDDFLPNRFYSNQLLEEEILKSNHREEYEKAKGGKMQNVLSTFFHDYVMRGQGTDIAAYTKKMGARICETNYYQYEHELSAKESEIHGHTMRAIYSTMNKNGEKQYISLDFKHGMLEYHDKKGRHLGEFRFTGLKNADGEVSHDLTSLY